MIESLPNVKITERIPSNDPFRDRWVSGEWDNEPELIEWFYTEPNKIQMYPCIVVRTALCYLCGYVGTKDRLSDDISDLLIVHGGITFGDRRLPDYIPTAFKDTNGIYWYGFDCAHAWDVSPHSSIYEVTKHGTYKTVQYVMNECQLLAKQIAAYAKGNLQ